MSEGIKHVITCDPFVSCQILNVEKNRLKSLPDSIGDLRLLQTLSLNGTVLIAHYWVSERTFPSQIELVMYFYHYIHIGNCLSELPPSIGSLTSLRTLNLSNNNIVQLPKTLAYIRTLEVCLGSKITVRL